MIETERAAEREGVSQLVGVKHLAIESYRKNGEAVRTPVWFIEKDGTLFVRTDGDTGKAKRIRGNPRIRIAPCTIRGKPKGDWVNAEASSQEKKRLRRLTSFSRRNMECNID